MADVKLAGFNLNPDAVKKFNWGGMLPTGFMSGINLPVPAAVNEGPTGIEKAAAIARKYRQGPIDLTKLSPEDRGLAALMQATRPDLETAVFTAEANRQGAIEAAKMQRENYEFLSEMGKKRQARQFTYDQLGNLFSTIPRAFSPIPYEKTQELAANIANISSPRNLSAQPGIQAASYALPTRQYFA